MARNPLAFPGKAAAAEGYGGAQAYNATVVLHNAHNNPLMRVAAWVLQEDAEARAKQDKTGGFGKFGWDPRSHPACSEHPPRGCPV